MPPLALLAGGLATRLGGIAKDTPKVMVEVAGEPFISHQMRLLKRNGISRVVICAGHMGIKIKDFVGDGDKFEMEVSYSFDGQRLVGTGGALKKALPQLGEVFWYMYGDAYLDIDFAPALGHFMRNRGKGLMTVLRNEDRWDRSNVLFSEGRVLRYDKKNPGPDMRFIDYGLGLFRREAFDGYPEGEGFDLAGLHSALAEGGELLGFEVHKRFYEIGSPEGLEETRQYLGTRRTA